MKLARPSRHPFHLPRRCFGKSRSPSGLGAAASTLRAASAACVRLVATPSTARAALGFVVALAALSSLVFAPSCTAFIGCEKVRKCPAEGGMGGELPGAGGEADGGESTNGGAPSAGNDGSGSDPSACLPGDFVAAVDDPLVCEPCPSGTFSTRENQTSCSPWRDCEPGSRVALKGSASSDRECEPCPEQMFTSEPNLTQCTSWTECAPGYITDAPGSSSEDRSCRFEEWTRQFGTSEEDYVHAVALDGAGDIVVVGTSDGALQNASAGATDAYVRVFSPSGDVLWTRQFGTNAVDDATSVAVGSDGNIIVAGATNGSLHGDSMGLSDAYVRVFSPIGDLVWTRQFGTSEFDDATSVAVDGNGDIVVVGTSDGALQNASAGGSDAYVRVFSPTGGVLGPANSARPATTVPTPLLRTAPGTSPLWGRPRGPCRERTLAGRTCSSCAWPEDRRSEESRRTEIQEPTD